MLTFGNFLVLLFLVGAVALVLKRFGVPNLRRPTKEKKQEEGNETMSSSAAHEDDAHAHEDDAHGHGHNDAPKTKTEVSNGKAMVFYRSNKELFDIAIALLVVLFAYLRYHWDGVQGDAVYVVIGLGVYYGLSRDSDALKYFAWTAGVVIILIAVIGMMFPQIAEDVTKWNPFGPTAPGLSGEAARTHETMTPTWKTTADDGSLPVDEWSADMDVQPGCGFSFAAGYGVDYIAQYKRRVDPEWIDIALGEIPKMVIKTRYKILKEGMKELPIRITCS